MTATAMLDLRRTDLRTNVLENPFWMTSGNLTYAADAKAAVFFSFPQIQSDRSPGYGDSIVVIHNLVLEVITAFTSDTTGFQLGAGTIATDAAINDDTVTEVETDRFINDTHGDDMIILGGFHYPGKYGGGMHSESVFTEAWEKGRIDGDNSILPLDALVPCIVGYLTGGTLIAGSAYLHALISRVPAVGG